MKTKGFTLIEIMIVIAIIGMLASVVIPVAINLIEDARANICQENLRTIDNTKMAWATDNNQPDDAEPTEEELADYVNGDLPQPVVAGALYKIGAVIAPALCSFHGNMAVAGSGITMPSTIADFLNNSEQINAGDIMDDDWLWVNNGMLTTYEDEYLATRTAAWGGLHMNILDLNEKTG